VSAATIGSTFAATVVLVVSADANPSPKPALLTGCLSAGIGKTDGMLYDPGPSKAVGCQHDGQP